MNAAFDKIQGNDFLTLDLLEIDSAEIPIPQKLVSVRHYDIETILPKQLLLPRVRMAG